MEQVDRAEHYAFVKKQVVEIADHKHDQDYRTARLFRATAFSKGQKGDEDHRGELGRDTVFQDHVQNCISMRSGRIQDRFLKGKIGNAAGGDIGWNILIAAGMFPGNLAQFAVHPQQTGRHR